MRRIWDTPFFCGVENFRLSFSMTMSPAKVSEFARSKDLQKLK
jgi:hypothetical protein